MQNPCILLMDKPKSEFIPECNNCMFQENAECKGKKEEKSSEDNNFINAF